METYSLKTASGYVPTIHVFFFIWNFKIVVVGHFHAKSFISVANAKLCGAKKNSEAAFCS